MGPLAWHDMMHAYEVWANCQQEGHHPWNQLACLRAWDRACMAWVARQLLTRLWLASAPQCRGAIPAAGGEHWLATIPVYNLALE